MTFERFRHAFAVGRILRRGRTRALSEHLAKAWKVVLPENGPCGEDARFLPEFEALRNESVHVSACRRTAPGSVRLPAKTSDNTVAPDYIRFKNNEHRRHAPGRSYYAGQALSSDAPDARYHSVWLVVANLKIFSCGMPRAFVTAKDEDRETARRCSVAAAVRKASTKLPGSSQRNTGPGFYFAGPCPPSPQPLGLLSPPPPQTASGIN